VRGSITIGANASEEEIKTAAMSSPNVQKHLEGKLVIKVIIIPKKMINIIAK
jgi:leucyl-tRNA synthetase